MEKSIKAGTSRARACRLCRDKVVQVDFKDTRNLKQFLSEEGKILSRAQTGNCAEHQKAVTLAIKRCRELGLA